MEKVIDFSFLKEFREKGQPIIVAHGGGVNSTSLLLLMVEHSFSPDLILFADTGGEKPETYSFIKELDDFLGNSGFPKINIVKFESKKHGDKTLYEECVRIKALPSIAYGYKRCSLKWKKGPQDKFLNSSDLCIKAWENGKKVIKLIGYDAGEERRASIPEDEKYIYQYPLIKFQYFRKDCVSLVSKYFKNVPKSSCFFCPSMKKNEILSLSKDLKDKAIFMEDNMDLTPKQIIETDDDGKIIRDVRRYPTVKGLGRSYKWKDLINHDQAQQKIDFGCDVDKIEQDCGCYDG